MVSFLDGAWLRKPHALHCREVGQALAEMHVAGSDFGIRRVNALLGSRLEALVGRLARPRRRGSTGLQAEIDTELATLETGWPESLPEGVIHADLFPRQRVLHR